MWFNWKLELSKKLGHVILKFTHLAMFNDIVGKLFMLLILSLHFLKIDLVRPWANKLVSYKPGNILMFPSYFF
jgi:putative effector of murein hydrolase LrgA (UPF0299 family)